MVQKFHASLHELELHCKQNMPWSMALDKIELLNISAGAASLIGFGAIMSVVRDFN